MRLVEVAAGVVFRGGKLLITQRMPHDHLGGLWEFPGGKREPGESFENCLHRELMEELAIEVEIVGLIEAVDHPVPDGKIHLRFFHCRWLRHEPSPIACQALAWIEPGQLGDYSFPAADAGLLDRLKASPGLWV